MRRITTAAAVMAAGVVGALGVVVVPIVVPDSAPLASAAVGECPEGTLPAPGNDNPIWSDQNVAIYAGQDFTATGEAAEAEGLVVVEGDATFTGPGRFNVGWVGVGSGAAPHPGTVMLAVGGDVAVDDGTVLDVGANAFDANGDLLGGDVSVGGVTIPDYLENGLRYELNNGTLTQDLGADALAEWATWGSEISAESADFAALPPTGTVTVGAFLEFTGDGTSNPQVFSVSAAVLAANPAINFVNLADDVPVIVNVTGTGPITWAPNWFSEDGVRADAPFSPLFGMVSQRTLWNFPTAESLHVAGSSQVLGTVLAPGPNPDTTQPTLRVTASTNGRLYTNGSIVMDGDGNEHHNYPWLGAPFDCVPIDLGSEVTGSVTITKEVSQEDAALLPDGAAFQGTVVCDVPDSGQLVVEWEVLPGETTEVAGLPVGATCTVEESIGPLRRLALLRDGRVDVAPLFTWEDPVWSVNGTVTPPPVTFVVPDPADALQVSIDVTNAIVEGSFTVTKVVENPDEVGFTDLFTGAWSCELPAGQVVASGTWTLTAGQVSDPMVAPVGAVCTVSEDQAADPLGGVWGTPVISPNPVTLTEESLETPIEVSVTNTLAEVLGSFTIAKTVENPDEVAFTGSFTGAWSCELPAGQVVASGTWTLTAGDVTDPIQAPAGSVCTVTEVQPTDPVGGEWGTPVISPNPVTLTEESLETPIAVTVTNTLAEVLGSFTITKTVENPDGVVFTTPFTGAWSCELPEGEVVASGSWSLAAGGTSEPILVRSGSVCTVTEVQPADPLGGEWGTPVIAPNPIAITDESLETPIEVSVTNTLAEVLGSFTITKTVEDPDEVGFTGSFTGSWSCALPAGDVMGSGTWTLAAGETSDPIEAPAGSVCTVTEVQPTDPVGGQWGAPVISPNPITVTEESLETPIEVTVTNTLAEVLGSFTITKVVENPDDVAFAGSFTGGWTCELPAGVVVASGTWTLAAGEASDPIPVREGSVCTVTEVQPTDPVGGAWGTPVIDPNPITITAESLETPIAITVTNTLDEVLGAFAIQKTVQGVGAPDVEFSGTWTCELADGTIDAEGTWALSAGETSEAFEARVGSECTVTEDAPTDPVNGTWAEPAINPSTFTVTEDSLETPIVVTVTNSFLEVGGFTITKAVTGEDAPEVEFTGTWSCDVDGVEVASGVWALSDGDATAVLEAPVGAECTVAEDAPDPVVGGIWEQPVIDPASFTVLTGTLAEPLVVTVTNEFVEVPGSFTITKTVAGTGAPEVEFTGSWSCELADGTVDASGTWTLSAGETSEAFEARVGSECTVTEDTPTDPANGTWEAAVIDPASFAVQTGSLAEPTVVTVTNTFVEDEAPEQPTQSPDDDVSGSTGGGSDDSGLPDTGGPAAQWVPLGLLAIVLGGLLIATAGRRPGSR